MRLLFEGSFYWQSTLWYIDNMVKNFPSDHLIDFHLHLAEEQTHSILQQDKLKGVSIDSIQQQPKKIQHKICEDIADTKANSYLDKLTTMEDAARFRSLQGQGAAAWLAAIPSSDKFALLPSKFQLAVCLRLGLSLPFQSWVTECECGKSTNINLTNIISLLANLGEVAYGLTILWLMGGVTC